MGKELFLLKDNVNVEIRVMLVQVVHGNTRYRAGRLDEPGITARMLKAWMGKKNKYLLHGLWLMPNLTNNGA